MSAPRKPKGLGREGSRLWKSIAGGGKYVLRPDDVSTLEDACRIADMIDFLTDQWLELGRPTMTVGSQGQDVIHPLVDKIADHRMKRSTLLAKLKLPDTDAGAKVNQNRAAGQSRWEQAHGASS